MAGEGQFGGGNVGLSDILTTLKNIPTALNAIASSLKAGLPQRGAIATSATGGAAGAPPGAVAGYQTVTIDGTVYKVPLYLP